MIQGRPPPAPDQGSARPLPAPATAAGMARRCGLRHPFTPRAARPRGTPSSAADTGLSAARANGQVRLEVSDRGVGIKRQNMPHIFEPFFTSNDDAQGAGLGLAIARELADRMHGELTVRSEPGRTTFALELPA